MKPYTSNEAGWMIVYNNRPFFPWFRTRKEAREYNKIKTNNHGKVVRMKSTTIYYWDWSLEATRKRITY
jgi:hypothetical protein